MRLGAMMRLASIDEVKVGLDLIYLSIKENAKLCSHLYFLIMDDNVDKSTFDLIDSLGKEVKYQKASEDYGTGWNFKHNESIDELFRMIPNNEIDWVLHHDVDNLPVDNTLELIEKAEEEGADVIRVHMIEHWGSLEQILEVSEGYPIGPHFVITKWAEDIRFTGSEGFTEALSHKRKLKRLETDYCIRHMRYVYRWQYEERKAIGYAQDYFGKEHNTIEYKPNQKIQYYRR
jgi:hypothetical protein